MDGRHKKRMKLNYNNAPLQREQRSTKQKCGCKFTVKVIEPISSENSREQPSQKAHIHSMLEHKNHTPGKYIFQILLSNANVYLGLLF
jgi:hypothetical protein